MDIYHGAGGTEQREGGGGGLEHTVIRTHRGVRR